MNAEWIETYFGEAQSTIAKDLRLNLSRFVGESSLDEHDRYYALTALAQSTGDQTLKSFAVQALKKAGAPEDQIQEAIECAAMMGMLNTYYKFRGLTTDATLYGAAGLRMTALAKPSLGKVKFEMLAFAVSVLNGCPSCVQSHEKVLLDSGLNHNQIHDLARIASIVKATSILKSP